MFFPVSIFLHSLLFPYLTLSPFSSSFYFTIFLHYITLSLASSPSLSIPFPTLLSHLSLPLPLPLLAFSLPNSPFPSLLLISLLFQLISFFSYSSFPNSLSLSFFPAAISLLQRCSLFSVLSISTYFKFLSSY